MKKTILLLILSITSNWIQAQLVLFKDLIPGVASSLPKSLCQMNGNLYFLTNGGNATYDGLLWRSDGTKINTINFFKLDEFNSPFIPRFLVAGKNKLYFNNSDDVHGDEIWVSDGTKEGTRLIKDININLSYTQFVPLFVEEDTFYFTAGVGLNSNQQLFRTDGTEAGTILLSDTSEGLTGRSVMEVIHYKNQIIYTLYDRNPSNTGMEIWSYDLNDRSNERICRFDWNINYMNIYNFIVYKDKFYFQGRNSQGSELWSSDGTSANTGPVNNGSQKLTFINFGKMQLFNDLLIFSAYDTDHGTELWRSDGTFDGTTLIADINPSQQGSDCNSFFIFQDRLYFVAYHFNLGNELWYMTKAEMTPHLLNDIAKGNISSNPNNFTTLDNQMFFVAYANEYGFEIWKTDGNETSIVEDLNPIQSSSNIMSELFAYKHELYFQFFTSQTGYELFKSRFYGPGSKDFSFNFFSYPNPVKDQLCLLPQFLEFNLKDLHAEMIDINGKIVFEAEHLNISNPCMDVKDLTPGLYTLKITTKEGAIFIQKFVKS